MILPDTSIWLALTLSEHEFHAVSRQWFAGQTGSKVIVFCRATQQSLLRLLTTEKVMRGHGAPPFHNTGAWGVMEAYLADPRIGFAAEPENVIHHWRALACRETASPKLWMDAYLAAFAIAGGHQLVTTDYAFKRFPKLDCLVLSLAAGN